MNSMENVYGFLAMSLGRKEQITSAFLRIFPFIVNT